MVISNVYLIFAEINISMGIKYQLPNGKFIYVSLDQALDMDLEALQELMADDIGYDSENPWDDSHDGINPIFYELPETESEDERLPEKEKQRIQKDLEEGD